ncbi:MAG: enoyl-CoA hydratase/isomerase family protein [Sphingomonadales bacterium]|jgi:enoyl-CoA hydratase/carnithine racemase
MTSDADIVFDHQGAIGLMTLNRPQALNALNRDMCLALKSKLDEWADEVGIQAVVIQGAGDRAFCAGGDVVSLYKSGKAGTPDFENFFASEYRMNAAIGAFPKPYIALIDGVVMGGGVGVSVHGNYRIATERTLFAMPETGIGLIPDVGGGYFMPRLPGEYGMYLALTGQRLSGADCYALGIATHYVPSEKLPDLVAEMAEGGPIESILAAFHEEPGESDSAAHRSDIDVHFSKDSVEAIIESLQGGNDWAKKMAEKMGRLSPTSMKLTFRQMREGKALSLQEALQLEYRIVSHIKSGHDFYEGVRAQLVDKDRNPKWDPADLANVKDTFIDAHFQVPAWGDLDFDD